MYKKLLSGRKPTIDASIFTGIAAVAMLIATGSTPWLILIISVLFYAVFTEITGLISTQWLKHTLITYALLIAMGIILATLATYSAEVSLDDVPSYKKLIVLAVIFKVLLTGIALLFRTVLSLINEVD